MNSEESADEAASAQESSSVLLGRRGSRNIIGLGYYGLANLVLVVVVSSDGAGAAGAFFCSIAVFNIAMRILVLGADVGLLRFISQRIAINRRREISRIWITALAPVAITSAVAAVAMFSYSDRIARAIGDDLFEAHLTAQLRALAPFLPIAVVYFVLESASRGFGSVKPSLLIEKYGKSTAQLLLVSAAIAADSNPTVLAIAWAIPIALAILAMAGWVIIECRRTARNAEPEYSDSLPVVAANARALEFWKFSGQRAPAGIFQAGILWSDAIFIGAFATTASAGIYVSATRFMLVATLIQLGIGQVFQPLLSAALARNDRSGALTLFRSASVWAMLASWPALIGVMSFGPLLLGIYGDDYAPGATALVILGAAWMFTVAAGPVDSVLLMAGKSWMTTANVALAAVVNIGLNIVLIPRHGIVGAAIAWAVSLVINNVLPLLEVKRVLGITPFSSMTFEALLPLCAFGVSLISARILFGTTAVGVVIGSVIGATLFGLAVYARREQLGVMEFRRNQD